MNKLCGLYAVKNKKLKKVSVCGGLAKIAKHLDLSNVDAVFDFGCLEDESCTKVFVCFSNFSSPQSKLLAQCIANELEKQGITTSICAQNLFMLIVPKAPSVRFCGTISKTKFQSFEAVVAASAASIVSA